MNSDSQKSDSGETPQIIKTLFLDGSLTKLRSSALISVLAAGAYALYLLLNSWDEVMQSAGKFFFGQQ